MFAFLVHMAADINGASLSFDDDIWFQPIVLSFAETGRLIHPFMSPIRANDEGLLLWHGWLMPVVNGATQNLFGVDGGYASIKFSAHVLASLIFTGFAAFFVKVMGPVRASVILPILLCVFLYQVGRPEIVASGVLLAYLIIIDRRVDTYATFLVSICIALLFVTSPVLAVYISLFTAVSIFSVGSIRTDNLRTIAGYLCLVPTFVFLTTFAFTDLVFTDWLAGIFQHAQRISA